MTTGQEAGSTPIIVLFPTRTDLSYADSASSRLNPLSVGAEFVRNAGGEIIDLTSCLKSVTLLPVFSEEAIIRLRQTRWSPNVCTMRLVLGSDCFTYTEQRGCEEDGRNCLQ